ncbi:MAG: HlyD family efflux transporter periplasmic adaptor subunit [Bacteroidales bacterium]|nr:HlyD family efflux transporter periplasmic adaptor subunit [Bacteroidales bacterium]
MRTILIMLIASALLSCSRKTTEFDAMGHFEADEQTVVAETSGRIIWLKAQESQRLCRGDTIAITDTVTIGLQIEQLHAQKKALNARLPGIYSQETVVDTEIEILEKEVQRFRNLLSDQAVSEKSFDDAKSKLKIARAKKETFQSQMESIAAELSVLEAQEAVMKDQQRKCFVLAPTDGVVIDLIARQADMMIPGKPILKMANLDQIILKAYLSEDQLSMVSLGSLVGVRIDGPVGSYLNYTGMIYWIADQSEFTPKVIQTKKERVNLVYAIKIRVPNDGKIKIGMPGEMILIHE